MLASGLEDQAEFLTHSNKEWLSTGKVDAGGAYGERSHTCRSETERPCYMPSLEYVSVLSQGQAHPNIGDNSFHSHQRMGKPNLGAIDGPVSSALEDG